MRRAAIIQARYGSTRLKGKVLKKLGDKTALEHLILRVQAIENLDQICFAIADDAASRPIADFINQNFPDIITLFGDEHDVLARYHHAAQTLNADIIMRITSDCPLIDANLCEAMMNIFETHDYDYFSNNLICSFPHGLDTEIMRRDGLTQAYANATTAYEREHVTPWLQTNPSLKFGGMVNLDADRELVAQRWTLDYCEDLDFLDKVLTALMQDNDTRGRGSIKSVGGADDFDFTHILQILVKHPEFCQLNRAYILPERQLFAPLGMIDPHRQIDYFAYRGDDAPLKKPPTPPTSQATR